MSSTSLSACPTIIETVSDAAHQSPVGLSAPAVEEVQVLGFVRSQMAEGFRTALRLITESHGSTEGVSIRGFYSVDAGDLRLGWPGREGSQADRDVNYIVFSLSAGTVVWDGNGMFQGQPSTLPRSEVKIQLQDLARSTLEGEFSVGFNSDDYVAYGALILLRLAAQDASLLPVESENRDMNLTRSRVLVGSSNSTAFQVATAENIPDGLYKMRIELPPL